MTNILKTIAFNTCRKYAGPGQVIIATLRDDRTVTFFDHARHIDGGFDLPTGSVFGMGTVMRAYDGGGEARTYQSTAQSWKDGMDSAGPNSLTAADNWRSDFWVMMQEDSHGQGYQSHRGADGQGRVHVLYEAKPDDFYLPRAKLPGLSLDQLQHQYEAFCHFHGITSEGSADELLAEMTTLGIISRGVGELGRIATLRIDWLGAFIEVWQLEQDEALAHRPTQDDIEAAREPDQFLNITADTAEAASAIYAKARDDSNEGASTFPEGMWNGHRISYNARVWEAGKAFPEAQAIYTPGGRAVFGEAAIEPHEDDHATPNTTRADRARLALDSSYDDDVAGQVGDMLADLMHLCAAEDQPFDFFLDSARVNFAAETETPATQTVPPTPAQRFTKRLDVLLAEAVDAGIELDDLIAAARDRYIAALGYPDHIHFQEAQIIEKLLTDGIAKGYVVSVYDGEEWSLRRSADIKALRAEINATDITELTFFDPSQPGKAVAVDVVSGEAAQNPNVKGGMKKIGWVMLVHGNGTDVLSDYTANEATEALVAGADRLARNLDGEE